MMERIGFKQYETMRKTRDVYIMVDTITFKVYVVEDLTIKNHQGGVLLDYVKLGFMIFNDYLKLTRDKKPSKRTYSYDFYK